MGAVLLEIRAAALRQLLFAVPARLGAVLLEIRAAALRQLLLAVPARLGAPAARQRQSRAAHPPAVTTKAVMMMRDRNHSDA